jgi:hypothetical protein
MLEGVPADTGVCCPDSIPAPALVTASDLCDGAVDVAMTEVVSDSTGPNYFVLTRTWTAMDTCSNIISDSQVITVNDTLFPPVYPQGIGSPDSHAVINLTVTPNPFVSTTKIQFSISEDASATVELYNSMGEKLRSMYTGKVTAGAVVTLSLSPDLSMQQGMYLLVLRTDKGVKTRHIIYIK